MLQEAMDATLRADKALPLLDAAADKFAEVTISGEPFGRFGAHSQLQDAQRKLWQDAQP